LLTTHRGLALILAILLLCAAAAPVNAASPVEAIAAELNKKIVAPNAILMEASSGMVVWERAADVAKPIASVVKIMTLTLVMEALAKGDIKLDEMVIASEHVSSMGGSQIWLEVGEAMSVQDLLKAVAIESANDAAVALAEHVAGSEMAFVARMNERAAQLGCKNTKFINATGLPGDGGDDCLSSARDVAIMSRELLKYPDVHQWLTIWMGDVRDGKNLLTNTNRLIRFYSGADGLKTGYTQRARYCLSATAKKNGVRIIGVVLGVPTSAQRFTDASTLLDAGFSLFEARNVAPSGKPIGQVDVLRGANTKVNAVTAGDLSVVNLRGQESKVEVRVELPRYVQSPVRKGQTLGKMQALTEGKVYSEVRLVAEVDVDRAPLIRLLRRHTGMLLRSVFSFGEARKVYGG
jgi:D-alanyl-D-alanine carboxypeptidase (penicillin-binding protein 5/6)